jgi:5-formyltetrahydrofolate cyclo-ligase
MSKTAIRLQIKTELKSLSRAEIEKKSAAIARRLFHWKAWPESEILLSYLSLATEVNTAPIIVRAYQDGKTVFAPRLNGAELAFHEIKSLGQASVPHPYGMLEPPARLPVFPPALAPERRALVLVPGLGFDRGKNRLGRGKGFYDRFLSGVAAHYRRENFFFMGICFHVQLLSAVPHTPSDVAMDAVLTENEFVE